MELKNTWLLGRLSLQPIQRYGRAKVDRKRSFVIIWLLRVLPGLAKWPLRHRDALQVTTFGSQPPAEVQLEHGVSQLCSKSA